MYFIFKHSRPRIFGLLLGILLQSCNNEVKTVVNSTQKVNAQKNIKKNYDSISIIVNFKKKGTVLLNVNDKYCKYYSLRFNNKTPEFNTIEKKIPVYFKKQIINQLVLEFKDGKQKYVQRDFFIDDCKLKNSFIYKNGKLYKNDEKYLSIDSLRSAYPSIYATKGIEEKELNQIHNFYKKKYQKENNKDLSDLNDLYYFSTLQKNDILDKRINMFLESRKGYIISDVLYNIFYKIIKSRIEIFKYNSLNTDNYSEVYLNQLTISMFNFLRQEEHKGDSRYNKARNWLRTTKLYKNDSVYIEKEIMPVNNQEFIHRIKTMSFLDTNFQKTNIEKIISKNPSKYYLIDFWATWCKPCINGIHSMDKMRLPKEVKVISISVDKLNYKEKWKVKTNQLKQKITYLVNGKDKNNSAFFKFIGMHSIPRYVLIDKNLNVIDQAFTSPAQPNFLSELRQMTTFNVMKK